MTIYVDADSCPRAARELVLRRAIKAGIPAVFAANRKIPGVEGEGVTMAVCPKEAGAADDFIAGRAGTGDLAVTRDIPLAKRLVDSGAAVLDDRGRAYTAENIAEPLSLRNFMVGLAENGLTPERAANYGRAELKSFADSFDRLLARLRKAPMGG